MPVPDPDPGTSQALVERGFTIFVAVWQVAFLAVSVVADVVALGTLPGLLLLGPVAVSVALLVVGLVGPRAVRRLLPALRLVNVVVLLVFVGIVTLLTTAPTGSWNPGTQAAVVAAVVAGLTLPWRLGLATVVGIVIVSVLELLNEESAAVDDLMFPAYALALGVASITLARTLRRAARRVDEAHDLLVEARARAMGDEETRDRDRSDERTLHDGLLNTLDAIARGGLVDRERLIRERCREAAQGIVRVTGAVDLGDAGLPSDRQAAAEIAVEAAHLRSTGLEVRVDVADALAVLPSEVSAAVSAAVVESLRNVRRHAQARRAWVRGRERQGGVTITVEDDGMGLVAEADPGRLGVSGTVIGGMAAVGGIATVAPGRRGTRVTLRWSPERTPPTDADIGSDVTSVLARAMPALLTVFLGYGLLVLLASWSAYPDPWPVAAAFVLVVAVAVPLGLVPPVAARLGFDGELDPPLRAWVGTALAAVVAVVAVEVELAALAGATTPEWAVWSSEVTLGLLFVAVLVGPRGSILIVLAAWVVGQGGDPWELLRPGSLTLLSGAVFAWSLRRRARQYARSVREAWQAQAHLVAGHLDERSRRERFAPLVRYTLPLVERLADGELDPADPGVRRACLLEERFARSLIRLDPAAGSLSVLARDLVIRGRAWGVGVNAQLVGPDAAIPLGEPNAVPQILEQLSSGSSARLTATWESGQGVLRLVARRFETVTVPPIDIDEDGVAWWEEGLPGEHESAPGDRR